MEVTRIERDLCAWCTGRRAQFSLKALHRMWDYLASQQSPVSAQLCAQIEAELCKRELDNIFRRCTRKLHTFRA